MSQIIEYVTYLSNSWNRPIGLIIIWVLEGVFFFEINGNPIFDSITMPIKLVVVGIIIFSTLVVWLLSSKRILFRSNMLAIVSFFCSIVFALWFCFQGYFNYIAGTRVALPYIRFWGALIVFLIVILFVMFICRVFANGNNKLLVVFAVANGSIALENKLKYSIENVLNEIEGELNSVRLVLIPFGVIKTPKFAERFIKRPFTSADAVILTTIIEETEEKHVEYMFDKFTSRINERRFKDVDVNGRIDLGVVTTQKRCKNWNYINAANDNCTRTKVIFGNLQDMLQMYVGGILLMKHCYKEALPIMDVALNREVGYNDTHILASQLYTFSILSSARELEQDQQDYDSALMLLKQCASKVPASLSHPGYNKAMARVMFYKGDLKSSFEYTKRFKNLKGHEWGYELNIGFYAIYEKRVAEFVRRYKRLLKFNISDKEEIDFAIQFLEHQIESSKDNKYIILLTVAIAYLHIYRKRKKAKRLISKINYLMLPLYEIQELDKLKNIIVSSDESLMLCKRTKKQCVFRNKS